MLKPYHADLIFTKCIDKESPVELIISKKGVLTKFNEGKGGIHHIAYEVEDVEAVCKEYESKGMGILVQAAVQVTSDFIVNFLRPIYSDGILVEFDRRLNRLKAIRNTHYIFKLVISLPNGILKI